MRAQTSTCKLTLSTAPCRLGDHDDWGKTMPWQGSASVPFVIAAPSLQLRESLGLAAGGIVDVPVGTLDIAGTALDIAGVPAAANMTTVSLRPLLVNHGSNSTPPRPFVSSGLAQWRLVVMTHPANGHALKLVCCKGPCPGQPTNSSSGGRGLVDSDWAPRFLPVDGVVHGQNQTSAPQWTHLLIDTTIDPFDMVDVSATCELQDSVSGIREGVAVWLHVHRCCRPPRRLGHDTAFATRVVWERCYFLVVPQCCTLRNIPSCTA